MSHRLLSLLACLVLAPATFAITTDELVAKNVAAKGGQAKLTALKSLQLNGKLLVNGGRVQLAYQSILKRPNSIRIEAKLQGLTLVQAYDGKEAWAISPFQGRKDPEKLSADDAKSIIETAEIDGPLVDYQAKGSTLEYLGTEDVDGTLAHKVKVKLKNGDTQIVYLDPDYFLEIRILSQRLENGVQVEVETDLGDYEKVDGLYFPFSLEVGGKGSASASKQKLIFEKAIVNPPVDSAIFAFPTK